MIAWWSTVWPMGQTDFGFRVYANFVQKQMITLMDLQTFLLTCHPMASRRLWHWDVDTLRLVMLCVIDEAFVDDCNANNLPEHCHLIIYNIWKNCRTDKQKWERILCLDTEKKAENERDSVIIIRKSHATWRNFFFK